MRIVALLIVFVLTSCNFQEEILLPKADYSEVKTMKDHSPIYFFFRIKNNDTLVEVNKNNIIGTTNWIFNIDKRLPLKLVVPEIAKLQKKRSGASHKNENAGMYFSYSDSIGKNLAFSVFTTAQFAPKNTLSKKYIAQYQDFYKQYENVSIVFGKKNSIYLNDALVTDKQKINFMIDFILFTAQKGKVMIHLNFDESLLYNDYIKNKLAVKKILSENIQLAPMEFMFDSKKTPEYCGCTN